MKVIGPLDGRYQEIIAPLAEVFSEEGLVDKRLQIEIEYLRALTKQLGIKMPPLKIEADFDRIKEIEAETRHDVKAVEYFIREELKKQGREKLIPWVHFGITSEDVNNIAQSLMLKAGSEELSKVFKKVEKELVRLITEGKGAVMVGRTHGQPAVPTTMGKELLVYELQLKELWKELENFEYRGKLTGAVGTLAAHKVAYPEIDWMKFSQEFVESFGLRVDMVTTQIAPPLTLMKLFSLLQQISLLLASLAQNLWWYVSMGYFEQKVIKTEVGSSTMPQKVNPIFLENAEGNLQLASKLFSFFIEKLSHSRLQRDLSDSTVRRNFGVAYGHLYLALVHMTEGLGRLRINKDKMEQEVLEHPEMYAEALQTLARKNGDMEAYEKSKEQYRGKQVKSDKRVLEYTGIAEELCIKLS